MSIRKQPHDFTMGEGLSRKAHRAIEIYSVELMEKGYDAALQALESMPKDITLQQAIQALKSAAEEA